LFPAGIIARFVKTPFYERPRLSPISGRTSLQVWFIPIKCYKDFPDRQFIWFHKIHLVSPVSFPYDFLMGFAEHFSRSPLTPLGEVLWCTLGHSKDFNFALPTNRPRCRKNPDFKKTKTPTHASLSTPLPPTHNPPPSLFVIGFVHLYSRNLQGDAQISPRLFKSLCQCDLKIYFLALLFWLLAVFHDTDPTPVFV